MSDADIPMVLFRDLPGIADFELLCENHHRLMKDELDDFRKEWDRLSLSLFGITYADTLHPPDLKTDWDDWNKRFEWIEQIAEYETEFWYAIGLDMTDGGDEFLECFGEFSRQITCVVHQLHPAASFRFRKDDPLTDQQAEAGAEAWGQALLRK